MKNEITKKTNNAFVNNSTNNYTATIRNGQPIINKREYNPEILFVTSYPPRECGLATYSQDLMKALNNKFSESFNISVCALECEATSYVYDESVKYILQTDCHIAYMGLAQMINEDEQIKIIMLQHEFGLFNKNEVDLVDFIKALTKPVSIAFHTVLPRPNEVLKAHVNTLIQLAHSVIVMTNTSQKILTSDYNVSAKKINVISHGTHLVAHSDKDTLKEKYNFTNKKILTTFGLLSSGKSIETTLDALPAIIKADKNVLFLIIGKTHPSVVKHEGEKYRDFLEQKIAQLKIQKHVQFVNNYVALPTLLEYLQLTDVYLFTSKDPNQAVSGTFAYALSCGCPIISTPIPHAVEVLKNNIGVIIDFENALQLSNAVTLLLSDETLRNNISLNGLHTITPTAWENAAIAHAKVFEKISAGKIVLQYNVPDINLKHIKKLTTKFGMVQFSRINQPDMSTGYTLDDNARAMVAICQHVELLNDEVDVDLIRTYLTFIKYCFQDEGDFLNYVNENGMFTTQNGETNLQDSNGRAIWALGYLISLEDYLPTDIIEDAIELMEQAMLNIKKMHSTRAMAFVIKGLYYYNLQRPSAQNISLITVLADRLVQMYRHEAEPQWQWFESYLTYGNSILPEAMLCAWHATNENIYKSIAKASFDFLLSKTFTENRIKVISNKGWLQKGNEPIDTVIGGEQPIDVAYTIMALHKFYTCFGTDAYHKKMDIAFSWFLGNNHLQQIVYNPCTGGCYDGVEENYVNLNQGAESTVSYLMARLTIEKVNRKIANIIKRAQNNLQLTEVNKN
jgi:glycosyltransferase involved in cell wall biosynthesis